MYINRKPFLFTQKGSGHMCSPVASLFTYLSTVEIVYPSIYSSFPFLLNN